jgi:hypothetical protein
MGVTSVNPDNPTVHETTPLLAERREAEEANGQNESPSEENGEEPDTYNRSQVLFLSICALADPVSFFCIVPFVPQMVFELGGIAESKVGFYAGLIVRCIIDYA